MGETVRETFVLFSLVEERQVVISAHDAYIYRKNCTFIQGEKHIFYSCGGRQEVISAYNVYF